jgi:hypothetical protein
MQSVKVIHHWMKGEDNEPIDSAEDVPLDALDVLSDYMLEERHPLEPLSIMCRSAMVQHLSEDLFTLMTLHLIRCF